MENVLSGKWNEIKTEMKTEVMKAWTDISHAEIEGTNGNLQDLIVLLQQKFGYVREEAATKLMELAAIVEGDQSAITAAAAGSKDDAKVESKDDAKSEKTATTKH